MTSAFAAPQLLEQDPSFLQDLAIDFAALQEELEVPALFQEFSAEIDSSNVSRRD